MTDTTIIEMKEYQRYSRIMLFWLRNKNHLSKNDCEKTDAVEIKHTYDKNTEISYGGGGEKKKDYNENQLLKY